VDSYEASGDEGDDECSSAAASGSSAAAGEEKEAGFMEEVEFMDEDVSEKRTAQFTQYSMTSSVLPRSEGTALKESLVSFQCRHWPFSL